MKTYEYTTCTFSIAPDYDEMIDRLDALGKRGWKAYHIENGWFSLRYFMLRENTDGQ